MLTEILVRHKAGRYLIRKISEKRTIDVLQDVSPYLKTEHNIVDIGAGTCDIAAALKRRSFRVTPIDVKNLSCVPSIEPEIFDGRTIPYQNGAFDVALLINVLHHAQDPDRLLREAGRVARCLLIHEDIFSSSLQKYATFAMDSLTNLEFFGHPHSNRDDAAWRGTFDRLGFRLRAARYKRFWSIFSNATYLVDVSASSGGNLTK